MAATQWQRSLRRSTGAIVKPTEAAKAKNRQKRLTSITEDVFDENAQHKIRPSHDHQRRKLSTKGSISEIDHIDDAKKLTKEAENDVFPSPSKKSKSMSFLRQIPQRLRLTVDIQEWVPTPSPIPLPVGVISKLSFRKSFS